MNIKDYEGKYIPQTKEVSFNSVDGSDVARWLESINEVVISFKDIGTNGQAITASGYAVSTNRYVYKINPFDD